MQTKEQSERAAAAPRNESAKAPVQAQHAGTGRNPPLAGNTVTPRISDWASI
jgi:hypothetical protein